MRQARAPALHYLAYLSLALSLLAVAALGYLAFIAFVKGILEPRQFASYGLVLATVAGGTASFFSPCSFTVFPSFILLAGPSPGGERPGRLRRALPRGAAAALGAITAAIGIGIVIGAFGTALGPSYSIFSASPNSLVAKGIRIGVGVFVAFMGTINLLNLTTRVPLVGRVATWAAGVSGGAAPSLRSAYVYGVFYIAVGFG
ncbi:MAG: hypothetical protein HY688_03170 [Chloroflexi bacterium]|nr:hypothetical protein [Chloroflexota bacterium]